MELSTSDIQYFYSMYEHFKSGKSKRAFLSDYNMIYPEGILICVIPGYNKELIFNRYWPYLMPVEKLRNIMSVMQYFSLSEV